MEPTTSSSPARRAKFGIGAAVIALTLIGLIVWAMARPGSTAYYMSPSELSAAARPPARDVRVNGVVVAGSIDRDGLTTTFDVTDGRTELAITTDRPLPDTFKDGSEVVALGRFDGSTFAATEVLAKCPSKFKAKS